LAGDDVTTRLYELTKQAAELTDAPAIEGPLDPDLFLPDVLDSIALTTLLTLIEDEWDVAFDDEELEPEMFESLATLSRAVAEKIRRRRSA
jgi:acyl carrier protein